MDSLSRYLKLDGIKEIKNDADGKPFTGIVLDTDGSTVLRYRNGLLDGDVYENEKLVEVVPAVNAALHTEYWREGKIHRDGEYPAVTDNGSTEIWHDGNRII